MSFIFEKSITLTIARDEFRKNARPELTDKVKNMDNYEVIYFGYPNWWGTFPMSVFSFFESYYFIGKTIIPFCTNEGIGLGNSERDFKKLCPNAKVLPGIAIRGGSVTSADNVVQSWLNKHQ